MILSADEDLRLDIPVDPVKTGSVVLNAGVGIGSDYKGDYYNPAAGIKIAAEWDFSYFAGFGAPLIVTRYCKIDCSCFSSITSLPCFLFNF